MRSDGSCLPSPWGSPSGRAVLVCTCLLVLLLLLLPLSTATGQAKPQTSPIESFASETLLPLAEQALSSSETSDADLQTLKQQKIEDDKQRKIEQNDSATLLKEQSDRVTILQTYSDNLLAQLGDFSGSEAEKQAAALVALQKIKDDAVAVELQNKILRGALIGTGVATLIAIIVAVAR